LAKALLGADERDYIAHVDYVHQAQACAKRYRMAIFIFSSICYSRYLFERLGAGFDEIEELQTGERGE
jgi:hypothetical protein